MKKAIIKNARSVISLKNNIESTKRRYCLNCDNPVVKDEHEFNLYRCMVCGIPVNIKETSPERELNTVFHINSSGKSNRVVSKGGKKKSNQTNLELQIERLHEKGIDMFDFLTQQFDINGVQVKDIKIHLSTERDKRKSYQ